jgi:predicted transcriptional regulator
MKTLGNLEKEVMDIIWEEKTCSTRDVLIKLGKKHKLAYTTVATMLQRLYEKDLVVRKGDKSGYTYTPKFSKEVYSKKIAKGFIHSFVNSFGDSAIVSFVEGIDGLPQEKRAYFVKLLEEHDKNK